MMSHRTTVVLIAASLFILPGCGDTGMGQVEGVITFDGAPLAEASVSFTHIEGGRPATGFTDSEGRYQLKTLAPGDGAKVGRSQVAVIATEVTQKSNRPVNQDPEFASLDGFGPGYKPPRTKWLIPQHYGKASSSGLEFEVKPGDNQADFELTSK